MDLAQDLKDAFQDDRARGELRAWSLIGVGSLGLAGIFALLLAFSRVPGTEALIAWPHDFFESGLVIHVIYSFVVWFLAMLGALITVVIHRATDGDMWGRSVGKTAIQMTAAAVLLLFVPVFMDGTQPSLNNYVPVLIHPLYYMALAFLFMGTFFQAVRLLMLIARHRPTLDALSLSTVAGAVIVLAALIAFVIGAYQSGGEKPTVAVNEDIFWGGGHILQFVNVALMVGIWVWLCSRALSRDDMPPRFKPLIGFLVLGGLAAPFIYAVTETHSVDQRELFTNFQYLLAPTPTIIAGILLLMVVRAPAPVAPDQRLARLGLLMSMAVFFVGAFLGLFVDGADTRTPAHYHGVIGGVNLSFMVLFFSLLLPLLGRARALGKAAFALVWLYGVGQILHALGLFFAGGYGAPRKTAGDIDAMEAFGAQVSLYMMGIGALIAVIGGATFIWLMLKALLSKPDTKSSGADGAVGV